MVAISNAGLFSSRNSGRQIRFGSRLTPPSLFGVRLGCLVDEVASSVLALGLHLLDRIVVPVLLREAEYQRYRCRARTSWGAWRQGS